MRLNKFINNMQLGVALEPNEVKALCYETKNLNLSSVYVNGIFVELAARELKDSSIKVGTIIGYPFGTVSSEVKQFETEKCIENGATEISLIVNLGMLKSGNIEYIQSEIKNIKKIVGPYLLKIVVNMDYLTYEEKKILIYSCLDLGVNNFELLKRNVKVEDIDEINNLVKSEINLSLVGEIKDLSVMEKYISLGIKAFNTSSGSKLGKEIREKFWS